MALENVAGAIAALRVIDLTRVPGGAFCTQILAGHGADVIKIELATDSRTARNRDRLANREAMRSELIAMLSRHDCEPLCGRLLAAGQPGRCRVSTRR